MSQQDENIYQIVKSGEYYKKAVEWYNIVYVYPVIQRSLFITISAVCIFAILIATYAFYSFLPVVRMVQIPVGIDDLSEEYSHVIKLPAAEDPNNAVMKHMIKEYVKAREEYNFNDIPKNLNFIKGLSSETEYTNFAYQMNIRNPDSPILRYKQNAMVNIGISTIKIERVKRDGTPEGLKEEKVEPEPVAGEENKNEEKPKEDKAQETKPEPPEDKKTEAEKYYPDKKIATVKFTRREVSYAGKRTTKHEAVIEFNFTDIKYDPVEKTFLPLDLSVQNYKVMELQDNNKKQ